MKKCPGRFLLKEFINKDEWINCVVKLQVFYDNRLEITYLYMLTMYFEANTTSHADRYGTEIL